MYLSQKLTSNYSIANITCQCYLIGLVDVYVAINQYSKYFYRNIVSINVNTCVCIHMRLTGSPKNPYQRQSLRGCLHESGLSYNPDRSHFICVETIGD